MDAGLIAAVIGGYFLLLIIVSRLTAGKGDNLSFFLADRKAPWPVIAFGMIGASLSGVTFISVPGWVASSQFSYMQMVMGYLVGYSVISWVLLPVYYRLQLTSIYTYLEGRFGRHSYRTGAFFFLISRIIGASFRLYLVAIVLDTFVFDGQVPFLLIVIITIALIWLYTAKGGMKTIIWTDTLQTLSMLTAVALAVWGITDVMDLDISKTWSVMKESGYSKTFFFGPEAGKQHFFRQFLSGAGIAVVMTGLDQDMMQKNLACRNLKDAQKNVMSLALILIPVNLLFLSLGALLYIYAANAGIVLPEKADLLFPTIALEGGLGLTIGLAFIIGLIASAYSSADSALTALTTSFYVDILDEPGTDQREKVRIRRQVHIGMSFALIIVIWVFHLLNDDSVIKQLFTLAGYTYGPLLGMYAYGLFTKWEVKDEWVPVVCVLSPAISWLLQTHLELGFELLLLNGLFTFIGLSLIKSK